MAKLQTDAFHHFCGIGFPFQMHFQTDVYAYNVKFQQTYPLNFQNKVSADWPVYAAKMVTWGAKIKRK